MQSTKANRSLPIFEETDESFASSVGSLNRVLDPAIYGPGIEAIPTEYSPL